MLTDGEREAISIEPGPTISAVPPQQNQGAAPYSGMLHARAIGICAYTAGIALMVLAYVWALSAFPTIQMAPPLASAPIAIQSTPVYADWGLRHGFFLLFILLMTLVGWIIAGRGAQLFSAGCTARSVDTGKVCGLIVFLGGVALVALVFVTASHYFGAAPADVPVPAAHGVTTPDYIGWAASWIVRILILAVMALNGSLAAGRGVQLFLGSFSFREKNPITS